MNVEQRLRDAFQEGTADIKSRPGAWDDIQDAIARPARRLPVRPLLLAAAAASIAVAGVFALNADNVREVQTIAPATDPTSRTPTTTEPSPSATSVPADSTEGSTPPPETTPTTATPPETDAPPTPATTGPRRASSYVGNRGSMGDGELATEATPQATATSFLIQDIEQLQPGPYDVIRVASDDGGIVWLYRHDDAGRPNMRGTIVDGVDLPALGPQESLVRGTCTVGGIQADDLLAVVAFTGVYELSPVSRAWRIDTAAERLVEIDAASVRCRDDDWGL